MRETSRGIDKKLYANNNSQGKSFLSAVYAVSRCILYPGTLVVIASGTKGQATGVLKKIEELMPDSPNLRREILDLKTGSNNAECVFHNGSTIRVAVSNDNARHARAHIIIVDRKQSTLNTLNCWNILRAV